MSKAIELQAHPWHGIPAVPAGKPELVTVYVRREVRAG
jgi:hypothetical protein